MDQNRQIPESILRTYRERLSVLKKGQQYYKKDDIPNAIHHYNLYLNTLGLYYGVKEESLDPKLFDPNKGISEILLVSHVYWDMARAFDRGKKYESESIRCLDQFVKFTLGFKFQHLNAQMCKKFLRKNACYHPENFQKAYEKIQINSSACYIATYCYGEDHPNLKTLRDFKKILYKNSLGKLFVNNYYEISPKIVAFCDRHIFFSKIFKMITRPIISLTTKVIRSICHL